MERIGRWQTTFTGRKFWLEDPRPEDVRAEDIAGTLSRIPRFLGNTRGYIPYSVAQHCVLGSYIIEKPYALAFLLHDAPEAYTGDIITPVKKLFSEVYAAIEGPVQAAIDARFGVVRDEVTRGYVHRMDQDMLAAEIHGLLRGEAFNTHAYPGFHVSVEDVEPAEVAREAYLARLKELTSV